GGASGRGDRMDAQRVGRPPRDRAADRGGARRAATPDERGDEPVTDQRVARAPGLVLPRYRREPEVHPPLASPDYASTVLRAPSQPLVLLPHHLTEITGPVFGEDRVKPGENDLTRAPTGEAVGQRIIVHGRVLEADGRPLPGTLVEVWQANAGGRYRHLVDQWPAPLDPNFSGCGRAVTDADGRYRFTTIKPGAYPWG